MQQSRICILVVLQEMPFCVTISFVFIVFSVLISFMKIELFRLQTWTKSLILCFIFSKSTENSVLPRMHARLCCIHMTLMFQTCTYTGTMYTHMYIPCCRNASSRKANCFHQWKVKFLLISHQNVKKTFWAKRQLKKQDMVKVAYFSFNSVSIEARFMITRFLFLFFSINC